MNVLSRLFNKNNNENVSITVNDKNQLEIEEKVTMKENTFEKQVELAKKMIDFFDFKEETVFDNCFEASAFAGVIIYLQNSQKRRVSLADATCFFQRPVPSICSDIYYILDEREEEFEVAKDLVSLLSDEERFDDFKTRIFDHFSEYSCVFPDFKTFEITGSMIYMIENNVFNVVDCSPDTLQNYIDYDY